MCWEDVRIGRLKTPQGTTSRVSSSISGAPALGANPRRAAVMVMAAWDSVAEPAAMVAIMAGGVTGTPIGTVTTHMPYLLLPVEQYGRAIMGEVSVLTVTGTDLELYITELVWIDDPEKK